MTRDQGFSLWPSNSVYSQSLLVANLDPCWRAEFLKVSALIFEGNRGLVAAQRMLAWVICWLIQLQVYLAERKSACSQEHFDLFSSMGSRPMVCGCT